MHIDAYSFGSVTIDGVRYDHDVILAGGEVSERDKSPSRPRKAEFGHTPLTAGENLPWNTQSLWIGTGAYGRLPVLEEVRQEAASRGVDLVVATTPEMVERVNSGIPEGTAVLLHLTC